MPPRSNGRDRQAAELTVLDRSGLHLVRRMPSTADSSGARGFIDRAAVIALVELAPASGYKSYLLRVLEDPLIAP